MGRYLWDLKVTMNRERRREALGGGELKPTLMLLPSRGVKPNLASLKSDH